MWWRNSKENQEWMNGINERLARIEEYLQETKDFFSSEDIEHSLEGLHDKVTEILKDKERLHCVAVAEKTLDKFEDYMKNVDKFNGMINELKGCISMARAAIAERKQSEVDATLGTVGLAGEWEAFSKKNTKKIDSLARLMRKIGKKLPGCEKKSRKKREKVKKDLDYLPVA